eukprot:TRINITY_DN45886_c0_g1_i1.p2 TRINITY_DN45886_c0_g1~~TRINITY_DN45886_c0_g1_i1.p2  ORF type:complete len:412 (-),score=111.55 TRINITY_DN45886_c0_g1_i1:220-1455(-)
MEAEGGVRTLAQAEGGMLFGEEQLTLLSDGEADFLRRPPRKLLVRVTVTVLTSAAIVAGCVLARSGRAPGAPAAPEMGHTQHGTKLMRDDVPLQDWEGCGPLNAAGVPANMQFVNDFSQGMNNMLEAGWWFSEHFSHRFQYRPHYLTESGAQLHEKRGISPKAYWGWDYPGDGSVNIKLVGNGNLSLYFGNAYYEGAVNVAIDGTTKCTAAPNVDNQVCHIEFRHGDCLSITEGPRAIILINGLAVGQCSVKASAYARPALEPVCEAGGPPTPYPEAGWLNAWMASKGMPVPSPTPQPTPKPPLPEVVYVKHPVAAPAPPKPPPPEVGGTMHAPPAPPAPGSGAAKATPAPAPATVPAPAPEPEVTPTESPTKEWIVYNFKNPTAMPTFSPMAFFPDDEKEKGSAEGEPTP